MTNTPIEHPSWCDHTLCTVTDFGWHQSRPLTLDPDPRNHVSAQIQLCKAAVPADQPARIDLTVHVPPFDVDDTAEELTLPFSAERAVALGRMLSSAGGAATRDR